MDVDDAEIFTGGGDPGSDDEAAPLPNITVDLRDMLRFNRFVLVHLVYQILTANAGGLAAAGIRMGVHGNAVSKRGKLPGLL